jgi:lysophospholipase L1-like esterase
MRHILLLLTILMILTASCSPTPVPTLPPATLANLPSTATPIPPSVATEPLDSSPTSVPAVSLPDGALTVVTLGDSLTQGDGDDLGLGYPGRLQTALETERSGTKVLNFGKSGWASQDLINGLNGEPSQLTQALDARPNLALVWIGSNDLWYLYEYGPSPMTAEAEQADLAAYEANIDTILSKLTGSGAVVFIALLDDQSKRPVVAAPPNPGEPAFTAIDAADLALMSAHVEQYNEIIRRKAAQYNAIAVDFYNTDIFINPTTLYGDGNHPNQAGYDQIAEIWRQAILGK